MIRILIILFIIFWTSINCFGKKLSYDMEINHMKITTFCIENNSDRYNNLIYGQSSSYTKHTIEQKTFKNDTNILRIHSLSINPMKPFLGLLNLQYEFQFLKRFSLNFFSEYLAYTIVKDFEHPDMVNKFGLSYYPLMKNRVVNFGLFINLNVSYVSYFQNSFEHNSFANGIEIGYKWISKKNIIIQPKGLLNYQYSIRDVIPGFEVLFGYCF